MKPSCVENHFIGYQSEYQNRPCQDKKYQFVVVSGFVETVRVDLTEVHRSLCLSHDDTMELDEVAPNI